MDNTKKTLMIIGAGSAQTYAIKLAKKMGHYVVATDMNPNAPGFKIADKSFIASTYDLEKTLDVAKKFHKKHPLDGVMTLGVDVPLTVATIANELGLPGISIKSARLASNKLEMKRKFKRDGVPIPQFKKINSLARLKQSIDEMGYPVVLKPIDSRGARGVLRITKGVDLAWAFNYSKDVSPTKNIMVEKFISGPQISTESIVYKGKTHMVAYSDRNYEYLERYSPFIIENGGTMPSCLDDGKIQKISKLISKAVSSMGIKNGVVKGDVVYGDDGPKVIELAARLSGGYFCTDQIPLSIGVDIVNAVVHISLNEEIDIRELTPRYNRGVAMRFLFCPSGKVMKIDGAAKLSKYAWLKKFELFVKEGDVIREITDHTKRSGVVITVANNRKNAIERAEKAIRSVKITIA